MTIERPNIIVLLSDEHAADVVGAVGHPVVQTPNLDRLAGAATTYESAYCTSPMCVPSRLSMLSGRYAHQIGAWDNGVIPEPGFRSWGHHLREAGYESVLAGRTHFNGPDRLLGFDRRLSDDLDFWITDDGKPPGRVPEWRRGSNSHVSVAGAGTHVHTEHDASVTAQVVEFLNERAHRRDATPFILYVGYMHPHFPLIADPKYLDLYDPAAMPLPSTRHESSADQHPVIAQLRRAFHNDETLTDEQQRLAVASYFALVSHLDHHIGRVLDAVHETSLCDNTVIIYTSDHGEMAGHHGIWQKQCFYEPSIRVPLMVSTPEHVREEAPTERIGTDVSQIDVLPTIRALAGLDPDPALPGVSLLSGRTGDERVVFAEYHAQGMVDGGFMLKRGRYKYCAYVGHPPQLFDVHDDPMELHDLADEPAYSGLRASLEAQLRAIADPVEVNAQAKADQARRSAIQR